MAGNRIELPADARRRCASCLEPRRNRTVGWSPITRDAEVIGWTCPDCPRYDEPIRRISSGRFVAVLSSTDASGHRRQTKRTLASLDEARAFVQRIRSGAVPAPQDDPAALTLAGLADRWLARRELDRQRGRIRTVTVNGYRSALSAPLLHYGDRRAAGLTADDIDQLLHLLATRGGRWHRPLSHRAISYALSALRQMFDYGLAQGWLTGNPAAAVTVPIRPRKKPIQRWTRQQLITFREHADGQPELWLRAGMRLTLCGLRRSEVLGLDWANVDLSSGTVTIDGSRVKTGRGATHGPTTETGDVKSENSRRRVVVETIHPGTTALLRALWLEQGRPETGLIIRDRLGPIVPDHYSAQYRQLCAAAGVPNLGSIHNIRHTVATALKEAQVADHQAAALFGHDVATYRRFYLVVDDDGAAEAATAAGRLFALPAPANPLRNM